jgi:hypothetical protein
MFLLNAAIPSGLAMGMTTHEKGQLEFHRERRGTKISETLLWSDYLEAHASTRWRGKAVEDYRSPRRFAHERRINSIQ